jgi:hypothetical protein
MNAGIMSSINAPFPLKLPPLHLLLLALVATLVLPVAPTAVVLLPQAAVQARPAVAASRSAWPVALPGTATVRLKQGGSLSGRLVKLTPAALTLAVGQQSQTVALASVSAIEFAQPNDLWVSLPNGRRQQVRPIRGLSVPIDALPSSAIQVDGERDTAVVDLTAVLTDEQFDRLNRNPDVVYVLSRLKVRDEGRLELRVRSYGVR